VCCPWSRRFLAIWVGGRSIKWRLNEALMDEGSARRPRWFGGLLLLASVLAILIGVLLVIRPEIESPAQATGGSSTSSELSGPAGHTPAVGEVPPDFKLSTLGGDQVKLSDLRGHPVLINFWASWCGPCKVEMPLIVDAYNWHKAAGLRVLAIDSNQFDNMDDIRAFVSQRNMTFDVLLDADDSVSLQWNVNALPSTFFIRADGTIAQVHIGQMTVDQLNDYLKMILPSG
jgi:cytochrome c biogenesis protein CcmG/thiol:disulfide interchange protein DsbE